MWKKRTIGLHQSGRLFLWDIVKDAVIDGDE